MDTYGGYDTYGYSTYGYDASSVASETSAIMGVALAIVGIIMIIALIVGILTIIGQWKMFKKGGEEGWKSLIPFYSQYTLCKLVGVNPWWILIVFLAGMVGGMIPILSFVGSILSIYFAVILAISTARSYGKSDGFGVATIFFTPICYLILGGANTQYVGPRPMNDAIMGLFNKDANNNANNNINQNHNQNVNPAVNNMGVVNNNMEPTMNNINNNMNNFAQPSSNDILNNAQMGVNPQINNQNANKFCPQCGSPVDGVSTFCASCGNKL